MGSSMMSVPTFLLAIGFIFVGVLSSAIFFAFASNVFGATAKVENVMREYSQALQAWCVYAIREGLDNHYPVGIEIEADKLPGGLHVKKVVVVVRSRSLDRKYELIRADDFPVFQEVDD